MGSALLAGWFGSGLKMTDIIAVDPTAKKLNNILMLSNPKQIPPQFLPDVIVFAVKPQLADDIIPLYRSFVRPKTIFISIAAGKTLSSLQSLLGKDAQIIRAMPNLPATISLGSTVVMAGKKTGKNKQKICNSIFESVGKIHWIKNEKMFDAVTAISGSGPAYLFHFIECLSDAAQNLGLPAKLAEELVIETIYGSAKLVTKSRESPANLREMVTSKGGTTEAALKVLMAPNGLKKLVQQATKSAAQRSKTLK